MSSAIGVGSGWVRLDLRRDPASSSSVPSTGTAELSTKIDFSFRRGKDEGSIDGWSEQQRRLAVLRMLSYRLGKVSSTELFRSSKKMMMIISRLQNRRKRRANTDASLPLFLGSSGKIIVRWMRGRSFKRGAEKQNFEIVTSSIPPSEPHGIVGLKSNIFTGNHVTNSVL